MNHKRKISFAVIIFLFGIINISPLFSQIGARYNLAAGLLTTNILGNNRAKLSIIPPPGKPDAYIGGSFAYSQPGIQLRSTFPLENYENIRISGYLNYSFFSGRERAVTSTTISKVVYLFRNSLDITSFGIGGEYIWANLKFANAKLYSGVDIQATLVHNINTEFLEDYLDVEGQDNLYKYDPKPSAFRLGGNLKLGVEGRLREIVHVNAGVSIGALNLIGRDDTRGELLTPLKLQEDKENLLYLAQVFFLIQVNL